MPLLSGADDAAERTRVLSALQNDASFSVTSSLASQTSLLFHPHGFTLQLQIGDVRGHEGFPTGV